MSQIVETVTTQVVREVMRITSKDVRDPYAVRHGLAKPIKDKKLPKKFKKLWIKALKSGDYAQGSGALCIIKESQSKTYCCLGVACSIVGVADKLLYDGDYIQKVHYKKSKKLGTKIPKMLVGENELTSLLAEMNDEFTNHKSFRKIAKWIKKTL